MSVARSSTRALVTTGVVTLGLVAPTAAVAAPTAARTPAPRYTAQALGPRATKVTDGVRGTQALGVADDGDVLVASSDRPTFVVTRRGVRTLAATPGPYPARATAIAPDGTVYGTNHDGVFRWTPKGAVSFRPAPDAGHNGLSISAANARTDLAGCSSHVKVGNVVVGSFARNTLREAEWGGRWGNCEVTGISDAGVATVTQHYPNYRTTLVYPKATTATAAGVRYLRTPEEASSTADAISRNGTYVVGRVTTKGVTRVAWLSHRRMPVALRGAGAMTPKAVTNTALVVGEENGRVVTWQAGRKTDLTRVTRLPKGWVLTSVSGVNARGQLAVTATLPRTGEKVAMRVTPTGKRC